MRRISLLLGLLVGLLVGVGLLAAPASATSIHSSHSSQMGFSSSHGGSSVTISFSGGASSSDGSWHGNDQAPMSSSMKLALGNQGGSVDYWSGSNGHDNDQVADSEDGGPPFGNGNGGKGDYSYDFHDQKLAFDQHHFQEYAPPCGNKYPVPEPTLGLLLGVGLVGAVLARRCVAAA